MAGIRGTVDFVGYPVGKPVALPALAGFIGLLDFVGYGAGKPSGALTGSLATLGQGSVYPTVSAGGLFLSPHFRRTHAGPWNRRR